MELISTILPWVLLTLSILIVITVLLQESDASLGGALGGGGSEASLYRTRRGFEKFLFIFSIVLSVLFVAALILTLLTRI